MFYPGNIAAFVHDTKFKSDIVDGRRGATVAQAYDIPTWLWGLYVGLTMDRNAKWRVELPQRLLSNYSQLDEEKLLLKILTNFVEVEMHILHKKYKDSEQDSSGFTTIAKDLQSITQGIRPAYVLGDFRQIRKLFKNQTSFNVAIEIVKVAHGVSKFVLEPPPNTPVPKYPVNIHSLLENRWEGAFNTERVERLRKAVLSAIGPE